MELKGAIQTYAWGKLGSSSKVAQLYKKNDSNFKIEESSPYAELWMGTHCNGPSTLKGTGQMLKDWITSNIDCLGSKVLKCFGKELPFLFKVLSIQKALSIQAHPSKHHAEELHKLYPDDYKDPNHKPELAIALTKFEALCGFRRISEIKQHLRDIPNLQNVIGMDYVTKFLNNNDSKDEKKLLKICFQQAMKCSKDIVEKNLTSLIHAVKAGESVPLSSLLKMLHDQFPGDIGCFCIYFLNHVILNPGESLYLGPNIPHAYLSGDCIECMACSDNVVRAGLTPKFRDVDTLCEMLSYECMPADAVKFAPYCEDAYTKIYQPQIRDFAVANIVIPKESQYTLRPHNSASIILVVEGEGLSGTMKLKEGSIVFLPANAKFEIHCENNGITIYQAYANTEKCCK